jgi:hypothetical protein
VALVEAVAVFVAAVELAHELLLEGGEEEGLAGEWAAAVAEEADEERAYPFRLGGGEPVHQLGQRRLHLDPRRRRGLTISKQAPLELNGERALLELLFGKAVALLQLGQLRPGQIGLRPEQPMVVARAEAAFMAAQQKRFARTAGHPALDNRRNRRKMACDQGKSIPRGEPVPNLPERGRRRRSPRHWVWSASTDAGSARVSVYLTWSSGGIGTISA